MHKKTCNALCIFPTRLGDSIIALSAFSDLLKKHGDYSFTVVCSPLVVPIFQNIEQCSEIIPITKRSFKRHWISLWTRLISKKFDLLVDMRDSLVSRLLRSSLRLYGGKKQKNKLRRISLLESLKLDTQSLPNLVLSQSDLDWAEARMPGTKWIGVCPTSGWETKCWSSENFVRYIKEVISKGYQVALFYGAGDREKNLVKDLLFACPEVLDLGGGEKITHIAASLRRCNLFLGNDSGLSHLAAACAVKTLVLFGPTNALEYAPSGVDTHILKAVGRDGEGRMDTISFQTVIDKTIKLLED